MDTALDKDLKPIRQVPSTLSSQPPTRSSPNVKRNSRRRSWNCKDCPDYRFLTHTHLKDHVKRVHAKDIFPCSRCPTAQFESERELGQHSRLAHEKPATGCAKAYKCEECEETFSTPRWNYGNFLRHKKGHPARGGRTSEPIWQCPHCPGQFLTLTTLRNHSKRVHLRVERLGGYWSERMWRKCSNCSVHCESDHELWKHSEKAHSHPQMGNVAGQAKKSDSPEVEDAKGVGLGCETILGLDHEFDTVTRVKVEPFKDDFAPLGQNSAECQDLPQTKTEVKQEDLTYEDDDKEEHAMNFCNLHDVKFEVEEQEVVDHNNQDLFL